ncbi:MAG: STAS domain-containing protein [Sulfurimonas sp.]|nr:STAS domain-containing protein [Sulfurimonas sp.]
MNSEKMAISRKQISTEAPMVTNEVTEQCIYTGLFGSLDSSRMNTVVSKITQLCEKREISVVIIDLGNVDALDTAVAGHLSHLGSILKLVGVAPILCGLKSELAKTMVLAGVTLKDLFIVRNFKEALKESFRMTGYELVKK